MKIDEIKIVGNTLIVELDNLRAYSFDVNTVNDSAHLKQLLEDCLTEEKNSEQDNSAKLADCKNTLLNTEVNPKIDTEET